MEPREDLHDMALFSLSAAACSGPGESSRAYVLVHTHKEVAWLYKIEDHALILCKKLSLSSPVTDTILEAWKYILSEDKAKHYGMVFWGHGYGVLKPHYDDGMETWSVASDGENVASCQLKTHDSHRGILPNSYTKQSITNQDMIDICRNTMSMVGQKIAFCGMDCCKGAMLEHAYQLAPYAQYLVGSQECELADGWDNYSFMKVLKEQPVIEPRELVQRIVEGYARYYERESKAGTYTLSSFDTSFSIRIADYIDALGGEIRSLSSDQKKYMHASISASRDRCIGFCNAPTYVDVYNLCEEIVEQVKQDRFQEEHSYDAIIVLLKKIMSCVKSATVAKTGGPQVGHAHGTSIYFPRYTIDASYITTPFALNTDWLSLINWQLKR